MEHATTFRVRYKETDMMGIAHHSNYLVWFELGRSGLLRSINLPYTQFEQAGIGLPLIEANCQYKSPAHYDEELRLVTEIKSLSKTRITFVYKLYHHDTDKLLAEGATTHVIMKLDSGKPVALNKSVPDLWNKLINHFSEAI